LFLIKKTNSGLESSSPLDGCVLWLPLDTLEVYLDTIAAFIWACARAVSEEVIRARPRG